MEELIETELLRAMPGSLSLDDAQKFGPLVWLALSSLLKKGFISVAIVDKGQFRFSRAENEDSLREQFERVLVLHSQEALEIVREIYCEQDQGD